MVSLLALVRSEAPRAPARGAGAPAPPRPRPPQDAGAVTAPAGAGPPRRAPARGGRRVSSRSVSRAGTCVCVTGIFSYIIYNYIVVPLG